MLYARTHEDSSRALSLTLDEKNAELKERSSEVQTLTSEVRTHRLKLYECHVQGCGGVGLGG